jgi:hypothetical protein
MNRLNTRRMVVGLFGSFVCFAFLAMAGCASTGAVKPLGETAAPPADRTPGWWYESFKIAWPQGKDPAWSMDLLLAREVVQPVLDRYAQDILLWRFHRRAVRDAGGDQFSFIFYATAPNARKIYAAIGANRVLAQLKAKGFIERVITDDTNKITRPRLQDTSDPIWSPPLQKAWPYFIMGASRTWLDLISQYADAARPKPRTLSDMVAFYQKIDHQMDATWRDEGGHAFLHHLDAIFGYAPVNVNVRRKVELQF